ncbi:g9561 [Coccomyxa viridis]|uniref:G9561 protein n=1 Tax=Coccomyxa viridis TaxID=1274662 RepID=A0ABP1G354_9CHLO
MQCYSFTEELNTDEPCKHLNVDIQPSACCSPVAHVLKHTKRKGVPCTPPPAPRKQTPSATVPSHISAAMALMLGNTQVTGRENNDTIRVQACKPFFSPGNGQACSPSSRKEKTFES